MTSAAGSEVSSPPARIRPALVLAVAPEHLSTVDSEFARYARDYDIRCADSASGVRAVVAEALEQGQPVALLGIGWRLPAGEASLSNEAPPTTERLLGQAPSANAAAARPRRMASAASSSWTSCTRSCRRPVDLSHRAGRLRAVAAEASGSLAARADRHLPPGPAGPARRGVPHRRHRVPLGLGLDRLHPRGGGRADHRRRQLGRGGAHP